MIREETYKRSVDILFKAYFNGTLEHSDCQACAVGNLLGGVQYWGVLFCTLFNGVQSGAGNGEYSPLTKGAPESLREFIEINGEGQEVFFVTDELKNAIRRELRKFDYSIVELRCIEFAFERAPMGKDDEDWMYNGLVAVLEVLADIHQIEDQDISQFTNHYNNKKALVG